MQRLIQALYLVDNNGLRVSAAAELSPPLAQALQSARVPPTPPRPSPGGLAAVATSEQIDLSWTASTDNVGVSAYDIYVDESRLPRRATDIISSTPGWLQDHL